MCASFPPNSHTHWCMYIYTNPQNQTTHTVTDFLDQNSLDSVQPPRAQRSGSLGSRKDSIGSAGGGGGGASPARAGAGKVCSVAAAPPFCFG